MEMEVNRFDVLLVGLDPTQGSEIKKTRPCYPTRIPCTFRGKDGQVVLDQLRTIDRNRIIRRIGTIDMKVQKSVLFSLAELFAP